MGKVKRFIYFFEGILMLLSVAILITDTEDGYLFIVAFLSVYLFAYAVNQLIYYFSLARYMVGGKVILCKALILLDLSIEVLFLSAVPKYYVMFYLVLIMVFAGFVDVLRALETKNNNGRNWKIKLVQGIITIGVALFSVPFVSTTNIVIYLFCISFVSSAITKISESFRKNSLVYIS